MIRDDIEQRVLKLIDEGADAIRADRTARARRLEHLLPSLVKEFEHTKSGAEIRACADAILARFDDAPVRSYVEVLAYREARECLREGECPVLA